MLEWEKDTNGSDTSGAGAEPEDQVRLSYPQKQG